MGNIHVVVGCAYVIVEKLKFVEQTSWVKILFLVVAIIVNIIIIVQQTHEKRSTNIAIAEKIATIKSK